MNVQLIVEITGFYASLLAICYLYLSILVIKSRREAKVSLGDGGNTSVQQMVRAHALKVAGGERQLENLMRNSKGAMERWKREVARYCVNL